MTVEIRDAQAGDEAEWRRLWAGYLAFYEVDVAPEVTDHTWKRILDPASPMAMRVAANNTGLEGFAIYLPHPSTWSMTGYCYLEDFYVDEASRGGGIGRALLDDLVVLASKQGWSHLYWHTDEGNVRARALYDSYVKTDGNVRYRMKLPRG